MTMYAIVTSDFDAARRMFKEICDYAETFTPTCQDFMLHIYTNRRIGAYIHNQEQFNAWANDAAAAWEFMCELMGAPFILR